MLPIAHVFNPMAGVSSDVAVVMPSIGRASIMQALQSVFDQVGVQRIQVLIGIDKPSSNTVFLSDFLRKCPSHVTGVVLNLPWSTSVRHGGFHSATDGGSLRAILSLMANARYVAYLDDDNTWAPDHLEKLLNAIQDKTWAFSQRFLVDEDTGENYGPDLWHSVGVDKGDFSLQGGLVDTNCLMVDIVSTAAVIGRWASSGSSRPGVTADRFLFSAIRSAPHGRVDEPTVFYKIRKTNILHRHIREARV
ncbi:MAG TPA: glycosyltransferase [Cellvibrionaceae bacterium]